MTAHTGRTNIRQAIPNAIQGGWRPCQKYFIEPNPLGGYFAGIVWATESGEQKQMVDNKTHYSKESAAKACAEFMDIADRAYANQMRSDFQLELGE